MKHITIFLLGVFIASIVAIFANRIFFVVLSILLFIYFIIIVSLYYKQKRAKPELKIKKTKDQISLQKLKNARKKEEQKRHDFIHNQIAYIGEIWDLTKTQKRIFYKFIEKRAYSDLYSKMTAALLPQLTKMIEECIQRDKRGCKREINSRINALVAIMKNEIEQKIKRKDSDFETLKDVYDQLLAENKIS